MNQNFIDGKFVSAAAAKRNINPSNLDDIVGEYAQADHAQTDSAIAAAHAAFPDWALGNVQLRSEMLERIGTELLARKDELGRLLSREEGKTLAEGTGEVTRAAQIFKFYAAEVLRQRGERIASIRSGVDVEVTREPVGVIGIITPWNFPMAIPAWKIAPALAYGNTVVFKPADLVPGSAWALTEIISRSGLPPGVFNLVMGRGSVVGQAMLDSKLVNAITFTGSVGTGKTVLTATAARMAKAQIEMGGKNPMVVLDDADLDVAVNCAVQSAFYSTGQRCTAASRIIVQKGIYNRFIDAVTRRMSTLRVDDALKVGTDIGPVVDLAQLNQDLDYIKVGQQEGARLVTGGKQVSRDTKGFYLTPALFADATNQMIIARHEIFGPVACVIPANDYEEALAMANDSEFGLSSGICTTSLKYATHFRRHSESGMVMVNVPTAGVDYHVPFGGRKGSSYGSREQGTYAAEFFTTVKTAYTLA